MTRPGPVCMYSPGYLDPSPPLPSLAASVAGVGYSQPVSRIICPQSTVSIRQHIGREYGHYTLSWAHVIIPNTNHHRQHLSLLQDLGKETTVKDEWKCVFCVPNFENSKISHISNLSLSPSISPLATGNHLNFWFLLFLL